MNNHEYWKIIHGVKEEIIIPTEIIKRLKSVTKEDEIKYDSFITNLVKQGMERNEAINELSILKEKMKHSWIKLTPAERKSIVTGQGVLEIYE